MDKAYLTADAKACINCTTSIGKVYNIHTGGVSKIGYTLENIDFERDTGLWKTVKLLVYSNSSVE